MSKIGSRKIEIPQTVQLKLEAKKIIATGPRGALELTLAKNIEVKIEGNILEVTRLRHGNYTRALHGLYRTLIANIIQGVTEGFEKKLDFNGVGFRAEVAADAERANTKLILNVGFSHPVEIISPLGVEFKVEKNIITVSGIDKQMVGQVAADVRSVKPVEPYKGKGIKYLDEIPRRKPGKAAKAAIGATGQG